MIINVTQNEITIIETIAMSKNLNMCRVTIISLESVQTKILHNINYHMHNACIVLICLETYQSKITIISKKVLKCKLNGFIVLFIGGLN